MDLNRQIRRLMLPSLVVLLAACGGGPGEPTSRPEGIERPTARALSAVPATPSVAVPDVAVIGLNKVRETRIGRTLFEYDYRVVIQNQGPARAPLVATLVAVGAGTTIVNGQVNLDPIAAGATVTPADTITLRHDRSRPFQTAALQWHIAADPSAVVGLPGAPMDQAVDQVPEYRAAVTFPGTEIDQDLTNGATVVRSKWILGFKPGTTVGQINALLQSLGASIVRTYFQTAVLEIRVPDLGSLSAMRMGLAEVRSSPIIDFAIPMMISRANELPAILKSQQANQGNPEFGHLAHHLSVKGASAWNARRARPASALPIGTLTLVVVDEFGDGAPAPGRLVGTPTTAIGTGFSSNSLYSHGYHVLGIAVASFNDDSDPLKPDLDDGSSITGLYALKQPLLVEVEDLVVPFSGCVPGARVRVCTAKTEQDVVLGLVKANTSLGGRMVVNYSRGYNNGPGGGPPEHVEGEKEHWRRILHGGFGARLSPVEDSFILVTSAGNAPSVAAGLNNAWSRAALEAQSPVSNTAVVENRSASASAPFAAADIHPSSSLGGNISAVGSNTNSLDRDQGIWSYGNAVGAAIDRGGFKNGVPFFAEMQGTSMAAPQVSGLAVSLWALRPDFTSTRVLQTIRGNANLNVPLSGGQPLIDAYATLLAVDEPAAVAGVMGNRAKAPVRMAILDLDEDDRFTYADAVLFAKAFSDSRGGTAYDVSTLTSVITPSGLKTLDRSRFDLNADGFVGGSGKARFNLDIDYDPPRTARYGVASYMVPPQQIVQLNEAAVTDFEVLCYYVYSPLWEDKDGKTRRNFEEYLRTLTPAISCGGISLSVNLPNYADFWTNAYYYPMQSGVPNPALALCVYTAISTNNPQEVHSVDERRCDIGAWGRILPRGTYRIAVTATSLATGEFIGYGESRPVSFYYGPGPVARAEPFTCYQSDRRFSGSVFAGVPVGQAVALIPRGASSIQIDCGSWGLENTPMFGYIGRCTRRLGDPPDTRITLSGVLAHFDPLPTLLHVQSNWAAAGNNYNLRCDVLK